MSTKRYEGKKMEYGSFEWRNYQEKKRKERQRRGKVGRTADDSYYTHINQSKAKKAEKRGGY